MKAWFEVRAGGVLQAATEKGNGVEAHSYYPYTHCRGRSNAPQQPVVQSGEQAAGHSYYPYTHCRGRSNAPQIAAVCVPAAA